MIKRLKQALFTKTLPKKGNRKKKKKLSQVGRQNMPPKEKGNCCFKIEKSTI